MNSTTIHDPARNKPEQIMPVRKALSSMKQLYTLCYPQLSESDNKFISEFRLKHDLPYRDVVRHHFTIAFGISDLSTVEYIESVRCELSGQKAINFSCRYAMLGDDDSSNIYYVFLVPDEGFSEISRIHDQLYRGSFQKYHRTEIPYIPHIAIATLQDHKAIQELCSELNQKSLNITGILDRATICEYDGTIIRDLEEIEFET